MELNGARSNPRFQVELGQIGEIHGRLLRKATRDRWQARTAPPRVSPVLATVTLVLERADRPMRAREIHTAAEELAGQTLLRTSVKAALTAGASGSSQRFQRVGYGVYQSTR